MADVPYSRKAGSVISGQAAGWFHRQVHPPESREKQRARGCIFVSYASPDLEIARFVVSQLQNANCLVWFDKEQLQPGENCEEELHKAVEERCGLFLSIISYHTASRLEGYNIFERNLAAKRRELANEFKSMAICCR